MKYTDINKRFTEITAEYLLKGYTINTGTMHGSQGEKAHIDLTDGTKVIRIVLQSFHTYEPYMDGLEILVGECTDPNVAANSADDWMTIWNNHLEIISQERYYEVGEGRSRKETFYGTEEEAIAASKLRHQRWRAQDERRDNSIPAEGVALEIARRAISKRLGISRISNAEIKINKATKGYTISYRGKAFSLR